MATNSGTTRTEAVWEVPSIEHDVIDTDVQLRGASVTKLK